MQQIGAFEAKTHLPKILKKVEAGEKFIVTRNGRPIAVIGPVETAGGSSAKEVMRRILSLRLDLGSVKDLLDMRDAGRR